MERIIIIPAFRPDKYLKQIVRRNWELENQMIVVDDGSGQEYRPLFEELGEKCIVLHHEEKRGKGEAIKTALQYIKEELWECGVIGIMDADGQHLPEDMDRLLIQAGLNPGALVLGTRTIDETMPFKSRMGNRITCRIFQLMTGVAVSDTQTGLRAFSADFPFLLFQLPSGLWFVLSAGASVSEERLERTGCQCGRQTDQRGLQLYGQLPLCLS